MSVFSDDSLPEGPLDAYHNNLETTRNTISAAMAYDILLLASPAQPRSASDNVTSLDQRLELICDECYNRLAYTFAAYANPTKPSTVDVDRSLDTCKMDIEFFKVRLITGYRAACFNYILTAQHDALYWPNNSQYHTLGSSPSFQCRDRSYTPLDKDKGFLCRQPERTKPGPRLTSSPHSGIVSLMTAACMAEAFKLRHRPGRQKRRTAHGSPIKLSFVTDVGHSQAEYDTREYQPNSSFPGRHYTSYDRPATRENHDRSYSPRDTSGRDQDRCTSSSSPYTSSSSRSGGSSYDRLAAAAAALRGGDRESDYTSRTSTSRYGSSDDSPAFDYTPSSSSRDHYSSSRSERESTSSYTRRGSDMRNPFSSTDYGSSRGSDSYAFSPEDIGRSTGRSSSSRHGENSSPYTTCEYAPSSSSRSGSSSRYAFSPDDIGRSSTSSSRRYGSSSGSRSGWRSGY
ncbi:hypothetical protein LTS10_003962 [Elasticomyces elasticus]|nr:hypothetical protein LTS10_003962 [Elasticomyces elasticus]